MLGMDIIEQSQAEGLAAILFLFRKNTTLCLYVFSTKVEINENLEFEFHVAHVHMYCLTVDIVILSTIKENILY